MFLTSLSIADICGPAYLRRLAKTNEDPRRILSWSIRRGSSLYKLFGAIHTAQFTLHGFAASGGGYSDSPSMPSRANAVKRDTARKYFFW